MLKRSEISFAISVELSKLFAMVDVCAMVSHTLLPLSACKKQNGDITYIDQKINRTLLTDRLKMNFKKIDQCYCLVYNNANHFH